MKGNSGGEKRARHRRIASLASQSGVKRWAKATGLAALFGSLFLAQAPAQAAERTVETIVKDSCLACHQETGNPAAPWSRISLQRKSPEGWWLTLRRMRELRGATLSPADERALVQHFSDTQGLAPEESENFRYALERQPNIVEAPDGKLSEMCARCHSAARFSLERRPQAEWEKLVHFHIGQFPSLELQALARDRPWFQLAVNEVVPELAKRFPLEADVWKAWKGAAKPDLAGSWHLTGSLPGKGDYSATLTVTKADAANYEMVLAGVFEGGAPLSGKGKATVYTGYEWRGALDVDGVKLRQVFAASKDGSTMAGRMFLTEQDEIGAAARAMRDDGSPRILALHPPYLKAGTTADVTIVGARLDGDVSLGSDVSVVEVVSRSADRLVVRAKAEAGVVAGGREVRVGQAVADGALTVYQRVDRIDVTPSMSIARLGGNGGNLPKVQATHEAIAYDAGKDGKAGTEDDVRLGAMTADWSVKPFDDVAAHDKDVKFAGVMDARTGVFTPADAGPNPQRKMSNNNTGNLTVVATVTDGAEQVAGEGRLVVTAPNFFKLPLQ